VGRGHIPHELGWRQLRPPFGSCWWLLRANGTGFGANQNGHLDSGRINLRTAVEHRSAFLRRTNGPEAHEEPLTPQKPYWCYQPISHRAGLIAPIPAFVMSYSAMPTRLMQNDSFSSRVAEPRNELAAMVAGTCTPNSVSSEKMLSFAINQVDPLL